jgi:hypothetical protein
MSDWIDVEERMPDTKENVWSEKMLVLCDQGMVWRLSYYKYNDGFGCWQRPDAFVSAGSKRVCKWKESPENIDSRWISIEDSSPQPDTTVMVLKSDGSQEESYFGALIWSRLNLFFSNIGSEYKITHWKPLR